MTCVETNVRWNGDGTLDTTFDSLYNPTIGSGINFAFGNFFTDVALQPDGKVLVAGFYNYRLNGNFYYGLTRLNIDGTIDQSFVPPTQSTPEIVTLQPDGKILVGGNFAINGAPSNFSRHFIRLNNNGSLDTTFNPKINGYNFSAFVLMAAVKANGKILIGGDFQYQDGRSFHRGLQRLNADGSTDTAFNPNSNRIVSEILIQSDDKILVGGNLTSIGGQPRNNLARLSGELAALRRPAFDFDGDGKSDVSVFRPSNGN